YRKVIELKPEDIEAHLTLGVVLMQQAHFNEALAMLKKGSDLLPSRDPRRVPVRQLMHQCQRQAVLDAKLSAVLLGTEKPAHAGEQIEFAQLCALKKLQAAA